MLQGYDLFSLNLQPKAIPVLCCFIYFDALDLPSGFLKQTTPIPPTSTQFLITAVTFLHPHPFPWFHSFTLILFWIFSWFLPQAKIIRFHVSFNVGMWVILLLGNQFNFSLPNETEVSGDLAALFLWEYRSQVSDFILIFLFSSMSHHFLFVISLKVVPVFWRPTEFFPC